MPRAKSPNLTDAELRLMEVVWNKGVATVADVLAGVAGNPPLAYSTVLTTLRILENKGYLVHEKQGRAFVYRPAVERCAARDNAVRHLVRRFFDGSTDLLLLNLLENRKISSKELARLRKRIEEDK
ncbi:MAG TPA: BlaI/MecI/CopY family transcriptional regulator [Bryobacteraceae bacterium]|nr:BlaI/MecI/CopY family transcriptional regulator [Bryobacteraceae bacterium]